MNDRERVMNEWGRRTAHERLDLILDRYVAGDELWISASVDWLISTPERFEEAKLVMTIKEPYWDWPRAPWTPSSAPGSFQRPEDNPKGGESR